MSSRYEILSARVRRRIAAYREGRGRGPKIHRVPGKGFYLDDDWFRFWFKDGDDPKTGRPYRTETHEMCTGWMCNYYGGRCKWHPLGCGCSSGACQEG